MILGRTDKGGAEFGDTAVAEFEVFDSTADSVSGFEDHHFLVCLLESSTCGKSRKSAADDCNIYFVMERTKAFAGIKARRRAGKEEKRECEVACHDCRCCSVMGLRDEMQTEQ
jgi:hypothetical protein